MTSRRLRIYVASSWKNPRQPEVVEALRTAGHEVYDFRNPGDGRPGFGWGQVDSSWREWSPREFRAALQHPVAAHGFERDMRALRNADATVMVLPCGKSAHLELGFAAGVGQRTLILCDADLQDPELMYLMSSDICLSIPELLSVLERPAEVTLRDTGT